MTRAASGRRLKRTLVQLLNLTLHPLSGLAPRSPRAWVFGHTGDRFAGNPRYLFLWISLHRPDLRATWISGDARLVALLRAGGFRARRRWSPGGILATLRARMFVYAHSLGNLNAQLSRGALLLNLWHGVGLKAVDFGHATGRVTWARKEAATALGRARVLGFLAAPDILVTTSDLMQAHFADQFELPPERCPQLGYPRLDCPEDPALAAASVRWDAAAAAETWIYLPTFRDTGRPFLSAALPDPARLDAILRARDAVLYVKPHSKTGEDFPTGFAAIRRWPDEIDINTYLPRFTGLVTDYSSVLYDYLAHRDAGAILYTFDYDDYVGGDRVLVHPYDENVAGVRAPDFEALCRVFASGEALAAIAPAEHARIRARFWGGSPRPASPAIVAYVERRLSSAR